MFGLFRPRLLLPDGITSRLTPEELESILLHELSHVQRRDNVTAALHMVVEILFWFHPLVWWIGAKLVAEGRQPRIYAQGILNVCKFIWNRPCPAPRA